jgi:hypothetical protein
LSLSPPETPFAKQQHGQSIDLHHNLTSRACQSTGLKSCFDPYGGVASLMALMMRAFLEEHS